MNKYIWSAVFVFCFIFQANGQGKIQLLCQPAQTDSVLLRWAPTDKEAWDSGNRYGYVVERYTLLRNGKLQENKEYRLLTPSPLKPAPLAEWEPYENDRFVSIAAECIFGEDESVPALSPVMIYKQYQIEQNKFSFALYAADQSVLAARLSGLCWTDKEAKADEKYLYAVHIHLPDSLPQDTAFAFTGISEYQALPKPLDLTARWEDKKVQLSWNIFYLNHIYNSYIVEKSTNGTHYTPISENATVQLADEGVEPTLGYRSDSLPDNQTTWYYRIRGNTAFGETGPPSDSIVGRGRKLIITAPVITNKEVIDNNKVRLTWEYPEDMNESCIGFRVYRSTKPNATKEKIYESKSAEKRDFTDLSPKLTNYYLVSVFDDETEKFTAGHTYAELIDSIPPVAPRNLAGKVDNYGKALLTWTKNTDEAIEGYRLYRSNRPDFEFLLLTPAVVQDSCFTDSINLNTLTKTIYYRLRAIDLRGNQSDFSEVLELKRPDVIPPVSPVIQSLEEQKNNLVITWINSSSEDVVRHHIYKKTASDSIFHWVATVEKSANTQVFQDNIVESGETYSYYVLAEDDSYLLSRPSASVQLTMSGSRSSDEIVLNKQIVGNNVVLTWNTPAKKKIAEVVIYKALNNGPLQLHAHTNGNTYQDNMPKLEQTVRYRIKIQYEESGSHAFSNEIELKR
ncbi:fibronectin type III domain-containing protein [Viscerimonas tarda]